jgi:dihydroorotase
VAASGANVTASVTPQHLLYTVGHLLQGCKYHLFCLPVVKYQEDVEALRRAVTAPDNIKFFAGTDSAPHTVKATPCGCAGGCFTGGIAPQLYADAFEQAGVDMASAAGQEAFKKFLCTNGANFYGLKIPTETFTLSKEPQEIGLVHTPNGTITPLPIGMLPTPAETATLSWKVICS